MFRAPLRRLRPSPSSLTRRSLPARRTFFSGKLDQKRGTWRGTALRWGLAAGAVYWYNTSPMFADDPAPVTGPAPMAFSDDERTVDAVIAEKRKEIEARAKERESREAAAAAAAAAAKEKAEAKQEKPAEEKPADGEAVPGAVGDTAALEEEADQQGAFNPETGEINWDCPCLGGMAHGPCGEEFKSAFSCFVYSKEEPKGMDCIDKFQAMQDCFRQHPDVYGEELADDELAEGGEAPGSETPGSKDPEMDTAVSADSPVRSSGKTDLPAEQQAKEAKGEPAKAS